MAVEAALVMRDELEAVGLRPSVKTTGGKGLHVYVRIERRYGFDETHSFARTLAERALAQSGSLMTLEFKKADRSGGVFVDIHRNGPGATLAAPFTPRALPGAPVSFPISWEEVTKCSPSDYTLLTTPELMDSPALAGYKIDQKNKQRLRTL